MTQAQKQIALAQQAQTRGLIAPNIAERVTNAPTSSELIESLFDLITGNGSEVFIIRMLEFYSA